MSIDMTAISLWMTGGLIAAGLGFGLIHWRVMAAEKRILMAREAKDGEEETSRQGIGADLDPQRKAMERVSAELAELGASLTRGASEISAVTLTFDREQAAARRSSTRKAVTE